jgi:hypothetical protein
VDPVASIVTALAAGASLAVRDETPDAVKGACAQLRDAVRRRLAGHPEAELALARYEADPQAGGAPLAQQLVRAGAGSDADLVAAALALTRLIGQGGKYAVAVSGSQGVQVGDHNIQVSYFFQEHLERRWAESAGAGPAGRLLAEVSDPFALEVHRPVQLGDSMPPLPDLPVYVQREHDRALAEVVRAADSCTSGIVALVGGSSTGKTRACWEALRLLRGRPEPWRLWHPIDPSRPEAALRELPSIGPRTVVWLNEAQFYLDVAPGGLGERVAAGLRELLRAPERAPVLVLATLWPQFWGRLTARPLTGEDPHAQARELLTGRGITVPAAFSAAELPLLAEAGDPRLALAARAAEDGRVIQFLAGVPELVARYRNAPPSAAALIDAAMDARHLGMGVALPTAFLEAAAAGYLTDTDWDTLAEDWLEQALGYTTAPCKGTRGPLARIRPHASAVHTAGPEYRLADYLDQYSSDARRQHIPPGSFWAAAVRFASPADQAALAEAAKDRGLLRDAARLRKQAAGQGNPKAATMLVTDWYSLHRHSPDPRPAQWAAARVSLEDPNNVAWLLGTLRRTDAKEQTIALLARNPAAHVSLDNPLGVAQLMDALREAGAEDQAAALTRRAAAHAPLDNPLDVVLLLNAMRRADAKEQAIALLARNPAAQVSLDNLPQVVSLLECLQRLGAKEQFTALLARNPAAYVSLNNALEVAKLLDVLGNTGAEDQVATLLARDPAAHVWVDDPDHLESLLDALREAGAEEQAAALTRRTAAQASLDNALRVKLLLEALREAGAEEQAAVLTRRAAHIDLGDSLGVAQALHALRWSGAEEQGATLLARNPAAHVSLDNPMGVARLLDALRSASAEEQAATLLARNPAAHVSLDNPMGVAQLLDALRSASAEEQLATLLARNPAAHVSLDDRNDVVHLLETLRKTSADEQVKTLIDRLPAEGQFALFHEQTGQATRYRFGREPDGRPALSWGWDDLD